jgi:hypothetical protein
MARAPLSLSLSLSQTASLMNTAPLLFLALCVDALVKLSLLVRYEELHLFRSAVHIRTGYVRRLHTGRKLAPKWN